MSAETAATEGKVLHIERWYTRSELAQSLGVSLPELQRRVAAGDVVTRATENGRRYRLAITADDVPGAPSPKAVIPHVSSAPALPQRPQEILMELFEVTRDALQQRDDVDARIDREREAARAERRALEEEIAALRAERERDRLEADSQQRALRESAQRAGLRAQQHLGLAREVLAIASELAEGRPSRKRRKELAWRLSRIREDTTPRLQARSLD